VLPFTSSLCLFPQLKVAAKPAPPKEAPVQAAAAPLAKEAVLKEAAPKAEPAQVEDEPSGPLTWAQRAAKDAGKPKASNGEEGAAYRAPAPAAALQAETKAPPVGKAEAPKAPKSEGGKAVMDPLSLYVKGLPEGTSEDQLRSAFERYGDIKSVRWAVAFIQSEIEAFRTSLVLHMNRYQNTKNCG